MRQKGFTLIEVLVTLAVSSLVITSAAGIFYQTIVGTNRTNSQVIALTDVHQATLQIKKDLQMTQNTDLTDGYPPQGTVGLVWTDYTSFGEETERNHSSSYTLSDNDLQRTYDGTTSIVGRNITYLGFTQSDRVVNVVVTATESGATPRSETLEFSVYLRTEGLPE